MTPDPFTDQDWEEYVETLKAIKAHRKLTGESGGNAIVILKHLGKDYSHHDLKGCSIEEGRAKRAARREEARRRYFEEKAKKKFWK
ncbi:hypothetical protein EJB05_33522 [Eragrostis curvula]|uniref:Uncharacterized protein n=1 Tax=Eragrostis curvula TaxID=38414 RepID=A0A5J9U1K6_9POAL|nr:hypothetical protein EJB05_33522 [Eragrostis curvula]